MVLNKGTELIINFDFRDWKYMTNIISFTKKVKDVEFLLGEKEITLDIDFSKILTNDKETGSRFEIGGRVFWETYVSSTSF